MTVPMSVDEGGCSCFVPPTCIFASKEITDSDCPRASVRYDGVRRWDVE